MLIKYLLNLSIHNFLISTNPTTLFIIFTLHYITLHYQLRTIALIKFVKFGVFVINNVSRIRFFKSRSSGEKIYSSSSIQSSKYHQFLTRNSSPKFFNFLSEFFKYCLYSLSATMINISDKIH